MRTLIDDITGCVIRYAPVAGGVLVTRVERFTPTEATDSDAGQAAKSSWVDILRQNLWGEL